jgi:hypothetical protein
MENRYYYMDADGRTYGPHWLSAMRNLWQHQQVNMQTDVRLDGTDTWQALEFHPEIYEGEIRLPVFKKMIQTKSNPVRLLVWTMLLLFSYLTYLIVNEARRLGSQDRATPAKASNK